jgi:hypothetical protein
VNGEGERKAVVTVFYLLHPCPSSQEEGKKIVGKPLEEAKSEWGGRKKSGCDRVLSPPPLPLLPGGGEKDSWQATRRNEEVRDER